MGDKAGPCGATPLTAAVLAAFPGCPGSLNMVPILLGAGADVDKAGYAGVTPLVCAAMTGRLDLVQVLRDAGADMDKQDQKGWTPLGIAINQMGTPQWTEGHQKVIDFLT